MSAVLLFIFVIGGIAVWWLSQQRLMAKPWLETGTIGSVDATGASPLPAVKIGLGVFLAVIGSLFALLISAYSVRMQSGDWMALPELRLLWLNTGVLVLSSIALEWAQASAARGRIGAVRIGLALGGVSAFSFLIGQLLAWQQLVDAGFFVATNPANAFFYLITALHGLHILGGLAALGWVLPRTWRQAADTDQVRLSVELCAMYWHFLLLVWIVLFSILALGAWPDWLYAICFGS